MVSRRCSEGAASQRELISSAGIHERLFRPWTPTTWSLDLPEVLILPADLHGRIYRRDYRDPRLEEDLSRYRRVEDGMVVSPVPRSVFRFELLRSSAVERTGAIPGDLFRLPAHAGPPASPM